MSHAPADAEPEIVVLDAHGVVFTRVFPEFVRRRAIQRGEDPDDVWDRWIDEHRRDFWEGRTTPSQMWARMFPGDSPGLLTAELESRYRPGPFFHYVATTDRPLWLLSNHRSGWLLPRLQRFGIADRFERLFVSDHIGATKPTTEAYAPVIEAARGRSLCLYDDSPRNVGAARDVGIDARLVLPGATRPDTPQPARRTT